MALIAAEAEMSPGLIYRCYQGSFDLAVDGERAPYSALAALKALPWSLSR